nr:DUF805 domain-containing protein [uncultured Hyphomonas sp.]
MISNAPLSFGKFARFFRDELKTPNALYLDGSVSALWNPATGRTDGGAAIGPILGSGGLAVIIPSIALFIRRLHDINQTGWIYLGLVIAGFIPFINFLASIAQIVIACIPGTVGPNKYGPDPKNPMAGTADTFV